MDVGPKWWGCVTTDTIGVPSGGAYGHVRWFERAAGRHGLHVAWQVWQGRFGIYTIQHGQYVWQITLDRNGEPVPLDRGLLQALLGVWEDFARLSGQTIKDGIERIARQRRQDALDRRRRELDDMTPDVEREVDYSFGKTRPQQIVVPRGYWLPGRREAIRHG